MQQSMSKRSESRRLNALKRYAKIKSLVAQHYEEGNQSKSKAQAFRRHINDIYPMGERTFWRIMGTDVDAEIKKMDNNQLHLDFD